MQSQAERLKTLADMGSMAPASAARAGLRRWLGLGLETHISLPVFAAILLVVIWFVTLHTIANDRAAARAAARASSHEMIDTYEAQVARNLGSIDQTLKVLKYSVELNGAAGALPALNRQGLLPSGLVFIVMIVDRDGRIAASNPPAPAANVAGQAFFRFHRESNADTPYVSQTTIDDANPDWHIHFSRRLNDSAGRFAGTVVVAVDPAYFTSGYERSRMGEHGALGLFGSDGVLRALRVGDKVTWGGGAPASNDDSGQLSTSAWDGIRRYTSVRRLHGFSLTAMVGLAESE